MSTRAIIAVENDDGTYTGAWNWNDGYDIKNRLLKDFTKREDVDFLLNIGMFNDLFSQRDFDDYCNFCTNQLHKDPNEDKEFIKYKSTYVVLEKRGCDGHKAEIYKDLDDMAGQDINVVYLFKDEQWLQYKSYPASKETPKNLTEAYNKKTNKSEER